VPQICWIAFHCASGSESSGKETLTRIREITGFLHHCESPEIIRELTFNGFDWKSSIIPILSKFANFYQKHSTE
jgi:hypothetical protein